MKNFGLLGIFLMVCLEAGADLEYPYIAPEERAQMIRSKYPAIEIGFSEAQVLAVLATPDEVVDLFEPQVKNSKVIGKTFWYLIQRSSKRGSVKEKQEKVVRVSFNLDDKVTAIDKWGF